MNLFTIYIYIYRVGTSEKGSLSLELSVSGAPGHSSMPEGETTIATLARAITRYPWPVTRLFIFYFSLGSIFDFKYLSGKLLVNYKIIIIELARLISRIICNTFILNKLLYIISDSSTIKIKFKSYFFKKLNGFKVRHRNNSVMTMIFSHSQQAYLSECEILILCVL